MAPRLAPGLAVALSLVLATAACGGDDDGGADGSDGGDDGADGGGNADGGGEPAPTPAEGQFMVLESSFGDGAEGYGAISGAILDPRPTFHRLDMESGACKLWLYEPVDCSPCDGFCDSEGECVPFPTSLAAGTVTVTTPGGEVVMPASEYGYYPEGPVPEDLFESGDPVVADADGGEVAAFALETEGVDPISLDLVAGGESGADTLRLEDGADLELSWDGAEAGRRVRLQIKSNNQGHGQPVLALIDCEGDDTGSLTVPRAMIEAFPEKPYQNICAGVDCPPSSLMRFTRARTAVGDLTMELVAGFERQFIVVHEP